VVRGEEWLSTLPSIMNCLRHWMGFAGILSYSHLMKIDNGVKRKLSKRKDPELGLEYYMQLGITPLQ